MVFGGTRIDGASNITRALARRPAEAVAGKITETMSADGALASLSTAADKLLKGKRLAIYDRTSDQTPRFARQYLISHERATHTVAVVRKLFAKASEKVAEPALRQSLADQLNAYLRVDDQAIRGGQLKTLVDQLKLAAGQAPVEAKGPDHSGQIQGLDPVVQARRPLSQAVGKLGALSEPAHQPAVNGPAANPSFNEKQAQTQEKPVIAIPAEKAQIEQEIEAAEQMDESFAASERSQSEHLSIGQSEPGAMWIERQGSFVQGDNGLSRQSSQQMWIGMQADPDQQLYLADEMDDWGRFEHQSFAEPSVMEGANLRRSSELEQEPDPFGSNPLENSFVDSQEDVEELEKDPLQAKGDASVKRLAAELMAQQADEIRQQNWEGFLGRIDDYSDRLYEWNEMLGLEAGHLPPPLEQRALAGTAEALWSATQKLEALKLTYDDRPADQQQWKQLTSTIGRLKQSLDVSLGTLATMRDEIRTEMNGFEAEFSDDDYARTVCQENFQQTEQVEKDFMALLEAADVASTPPDTEAIQRQQALYLSDLVIDMDSALAQIKQRQITINSAETVQLSSALGQLLNSASVGPTEIDRIARIRHELKAQRTSLIELQTLIASLPAQVQAARAAIVEDFGKQSRASQAMQAQLQKRLNDIEQTRQELQVQIKAITQDLERKVAFKPARSTESTPDNPVIADLTLKLKQPPTVSDPTQELELRDQQLSEVFNEVLFRRASLSKQQVKQLTADLDPKGQLAKRMENLGEILVLKIKTEQNREISKVITEHDKKVADARRIEQEAQRKKIALQEIIANKLQRRAELGREIASTGQLLLAAEPHLELLNQLVSTGDEDRRQRLEADLLRLKNRYRSDESIARVLALDPDALADLVATEQIRMEQLQQARINIMEGDEAPQAEDLAPEAVERLLWQAMPLETLENELAQQELDIAQAQQQKSFSTQTLAREKAMISSSADVQMLQVRQAQADRVQNLIEIIDALRARAAV